MKDVPVRSEHYGDEDPREAYRENYRQLASDHGFAVLEMTRIWPVSVSTMLVLAF